MLSTPEICKRLELAPSNKRKLSVIPTPELSALRDRSGASVDLRLGRWFRTFKQTQTNSVSLVGGDGDAGELSRTKQHFVSFGETFVLHPGRFVLGVTLEWLRLPQDLSGYVTGKSSLGRHGLVIETAAGLHPGFSGCLTLELANVGEVPLEISPGMEICQIFLHRTRAASEGGSGKLSGQRKPHVSRPAVDVVYQRIRDYRPEPPEALNRGGAESPVRRSGRRKNGA